MKRHIVIYMVVLMTAGCCVLPTCAVQGDNDFQRAIHQGAMARISVRVVDDERKPVCDVKVEAHFDAALQSAGEVKIALTDTNGIAVVSGKTGKAVSIRASKSGYYSSSDGAGSRVGECECRNAIPIFRHRQVCVVQDAD